MGRWRSVSPVTAGTGRQPRIERFNARRVRLLRLEAFPRRPKQAQADRAVHV
jgi:hypothetical protein